ncbi:nucleotidyltransferase family protein [bacterium]|nr:nucleotidyltransferase family protein [bacterium]
MTNRFSVVILAAGTSSRLGSDKLSLPLGNKSILEHTIHNFFLDAIDEIVIVTGKFKPDLQKEDITPKIKYVDNPDYQAGMSSSVRRGLEHVSSSSDAVFITPADIPLFDITTVQHMIDVFSPSKIIIPTYHGKKGHPVLLDRLFSEQCLNEHSEKVLYDVIKKNNEAVELLPVEDEGILLDIDTTDDYEKMKKRYR